MPNNARSHGQQGSLDSMMDALIRDLMDPAPKKKASSQPAVQAEQAVTSALAETFMEELARAVGQASPSERSILLASLAPALAEALAPTLAEALAPALAEALTPALVKALSDLSSMSAHKTAGKNPAHSEGAGKEESE